MNCFQGSSTSLGYPAATYHYSGGSAALAAINLEDNVLRSLLKRTVASYPFSETENVYPCQGTMGPWSALYFEIHRRRRL
jgi:hypothetical protein